MSFLKELWTFIRVGFAVSADVIVFSGVVILNDPHVIVPIAAGETVLEAAVKVPLKARGVALIWRIRSACGAGRGKGNRR